MITNPIDSLSPGESLSNSKDVGSTFTEPSPQFTDVLDDYAETEWREDWEQVRLGPVYYTNTSAGEQITLYTLTNFDSEDLGQYTVIALAGSGELLGFKSSTLANSQWEANVVSAEGYITCKYENKGIASTLELANIDFLGRMAGRLGADKRLVMNIADQNAFRVELQQEDARVQGRNRLVSTYVDRFGAKPLEYRGQIVPNNYVLSIQANDLPIDSGVYRLDREVIDLNAPQLIRPRSIIDDRLSAALGKEDVGRLLGIRSEK